MNKYIKNIKKKFMHLEDSTKKAIITGLGVFLIVLVIVAFNASKGNDNFNDIKRDKNNYLVYSKIEKADSDYPKYVPDINIESDIIDQVNNEIDSFTDRYLDSDKTLITYEYNINGILLSVVIKIMDYQKDYAPEIYFKTYNINLDNRKVISNESLLDFFQTDTAEVSEIIENQFKKFYSDLVKEGYYLKEECDYQCFLRYRGVDNYLDSVNYYIKDGDLIAYRPFIFYSIFGDEKYFKAKDFEFFLIETEKN